MDTNGKDHKVDCRTSALNITTIHVSFPLKLYLCIFIYLSFLSFFDLEVKRTCNIKWLYQIRNIPKYFYFLLF